MAARSRTEEVEAACTRMGMEPGEALRLLLVAGARDQEETRATVLRVGSEAARQAAEGAQAATRAGFRKIYITGVWMIVAAATAAGVGLLAIGIWIGSRWVETDAGPMTPREVEVLRLNRLEAGLRRCPADPGGDAGWSCAVPMWLRLPKAK